MKMIIVLLSVCVAVAMAGVPLGLHAPAVGYAAAPVAAYAAPVAYAAPAVVHAAPVVVAAPILVDNAHFSYGYQNPHGNGHVSVARTGPVESHSYTFRAGTWVRK